MIYGVLYPLTCLAEWRDEVSLNATWSTFKTTPKLSEKHHTRCTSTRRSFVLHGNPPSQVNFLIGSDEQQTDIYSWQWMTQRIIKYWQISHTQWIECLFIFIDPNAQNKSSGYANYPITSSWALESQSMFEPQGYFKHLTESLFWWIQLETSLLQLNKKGQCLRQFLLIQTCQLEEAGC